MKKSSGLFFSLSLVLFLLAAVRVSVSWAQEETPAPVSVDGLRRHVVVSGENLTVIAGIYDVPVSDLQRINQMLDTDILQVGQQLIVPGGEGELAPTVYAAVFGDSLRMIATRFGVMPGDLLAGNRLINRDYEVRADQSFAVMSRTGSSQPHAVNGFLHVVHGHETPLEIAARYGISPARLAAENGQTWPARLFEGQRLRMPGPDPYQDFPGAWSEISVQPWPLAQGATAAIYVENLNDGRPTGEFGEQTLHFIPKDEGYVALIGIDAFLPPDRYPLRLEGSGDRPWHSVYQEVPVLSAGYGVQQVSLSPEMAPLLEPEVREEEDRFLSTIFDRYEEEQRWEGLFQAPVTATLVTAGYGIGRSYNEGPVEIYHSGIDFSGDIGTPIFAAADGEVVFAGTLTLRGLSVIVNHGLGVMTGYYHLNDVAVQEGDLVVKGQPLGSGGSSGLSTGPHLHWDLRIMNVPVDGQPWLNTPFP